MKCITCNRQLNENHRINTVILNDTEYKLCEFCFTRLKRLFFEDSEMDESTKKWIDELDKF